MKPKVLLLDIGNVLLPLHTRRFQAAVEHAIGKPAPNAWKSLYDSPASDRFERGLIEREAFQREACAALGTAMTADAFAELYCRIFDGPTPGLEESLGLLRRRYRLALLSNTNPIHADFFLSHYPGLFGLFRPDDRLFSHALACRKPEAEIYERALGRLGEAAESVRFYDDSEQNVEAARILGIDAIRIPRPGDILRELRALD
jgi:putative hydrolase of the HAD superfamily